MRRIIKRLLLSNVISLAQSLFNSFKSRVIGDSGTIEGEQCAVNAINNLNSLGLYNNASIVIIPSGYKASKLYTVLANDGTSDFTFTRATVATRILSDGSIGDVSSNVPRLSFANCPSLLIEAQRTNLVFPSATASTQTITVVNGTSYVLSFYGTGSVILSGAAIATLNGTGASNRVSLRFTTTGTSLILTVSGTVTDWQLEAGYDATSLIKTTSASVTRNAENCQISSASSFIGQTQGTIFIDLFYTRSPTSFGGIRHIFCLEGTTGSFVGVNLTTDNNGNTFQFAGTTYTIPSSGRHKIALVYDSGANVSKMFVNGVLRSTSTFSGFGSNIIDRIAIGARINPASSYNLDRHCNASFNLVSIYKSALSNAQCVALTT